ncbi:MAG: hypothetical protein CGW95_16530 [Phenylobacterium zucineum]|nr:MAG: hypothetical protein CGW95_16530 [Phenylobacterium zucineum]
MFSVVIPAHNQFEALQSLLSDLAPAAVDGLIREVLIADGGSNDPTAVFCEDAGVDLVQGGLVAAAQRAKSAWLLVLPANFRVNNERLKALKAFSAGHLAPIRYAGAKPHGFLTRRAIGLLMARSDLIAMDETRDLTFLLKRFARTARKTL